MEPVKLWLSPNVGEAMKIRARGEEPGGRHAASHLLLELDEADSSF
jgi:hypothetical protein